MSDMMVNALVGELKHEAVGTRKVLERVPAEKFDWRPHEKSYTLRDLAQHTSNIYTWLNITLDTEGMDFAEPQPKQQPVQSTSELLEMFDANLNAAVERLEQSSTAELTGETWTARSGDQVLFSMPNVAILRGFVFSHIVHHRAQLGVYLRLLDVPIPGVYGPSADEPTMGG